jgi:hypothetical protein
MRCVSVRRTNLPIAGPGKARVLWPSTINAPHQPICSARYAPSAEPALPSCCPLATPRPCSSIWTKSQRTKVTPGAHAVLILDQAGWHGAKDFEAPKNISLLPLPPRAPGAQPSKWQFMRASWLSNRIFKSFDEIVGEVRLERAHRSALENHVHRSPRLGSRRSLIVRIGIRSSEVTLAYNLSIRTK